MKRRNSCTALGNLIDDLLVVVVAATGEPDAGEDESYGDRVANTGEDRDCEPVGHDATLRAMPS